MIGERDLKSLWPYRLAAPAAKCEAHAPSGTRGIFLIRNLQSKPHHTTHSQENNMRQNSPFSLAAALMAIMAIPSLSWAEKPNPQEAVAHADNPIKLGFGFTSGLVHLGHSNVGMSGAQFMAGWEFETPKKTFVMPFLIGGFGILTEESETHPSNLPLKSRVSGLFGLGVSGGINLGPFSPYLLAEGYALPGLGFSAGIGTLYHLHPKVALDIAIHWILIPDSARPFRIQAPVESSKADLNELGFFMGFEL